MTKGYRLFAAAATCSGLFFHVLGGCRQEVNQLSDFEKYVENRIQSGANIIGNNNDFQRPLLFVAMGQCSELAVTSLLRHGAPATFVYEGRLQEICGGGGMRTENQAARGILKALVAAGADLRARDVNGQTILHTLSREGMMSAVEEAVASGAELDARRKGGTTPLVVAVNMGRTQVVKALIDLGANTSTRDDEGWTIRDHLANAQAQRPDRSVAYSEIRLLLESADTAK